MGLLRMTFWVGGLCLFLALAPDVGFLGPAADRGRERAGFQDLFYIVSATISDVGDICDRRPDVCEKLDRIGDQFRNRALRLTGAAHEWLVGQENGNRAPVRAGTQRGEEAVPQRDKADGAPYRFAKTASEQGK